MRYTTCHPRRRPNPPTRGSCNYNWKKPRDRERSSGHRKQDSVYHERKTRERNREVVFSRDRKQNTRKQGLYHHPERVGAKSYGVSKISSRKRPCSCVHGLIWQRQIGISSYGARMISSRCHRTSVTCLPPAAAAFFFTSSFLVLLTEPPPDIAIEAPRRVTSRRVASPSRPLINAKKNG